MLLVALGLGSLWSPLLPKFSNHNGGRGGGAGGTGGEGERKEPGSMVRVSLDKPAHTQKMFLLRKIQ